MSKENRETNENIDYDKMGKAIKRLFEIKKVLNDKNNSYFDISVSSYCQTFDEEYGYDCGCELVFDTIEEMMEWYDKRMEADSIVQ